MASVEEAGLRRRPFLRYDRQLGGGLFALQMRQNFFDYRRVFNAGNDLDVIIENFRKVRYSLTLVLIEKGE